MPTQLDVTTICNLALDYLDEATIVSYFDDTGVVARWLRRNFWPSAWSLMRKYPWNFALTRAQLPASATAPSFGWTYAYDLPTDCLRIRPITADGTDNGRQIPFKVEGVQILTNQPAPMNVRYIRAVNVTGQFDQQFCDVLAAVLAQKLAHFITGKASYAQQLGQTVAGLMNDAMMIDALEGTPDEPIDDEWINARLA